MSTLLDVFIRPPLENFGLYIPKDPTYGRYLLETSPYETALEADKEIKVTSRRVFLDSFIGENVKLTQEELDSGRGKKWIYYKQWEKGTRNNCDIVMLHDESLQKLGINDYGGKWASHISALLKKGFRIIAPDLPTHGRSTGLHVYVTREDELLTSIRAVLVDVEGLSPINVKRKVFLVGTSMGCGIALNYCARHPNSRRIAGIYGIAPMIGLAPETMPSSFVEKAGEILVSVLGRLPYLQAIKGKVSDDPRVEEEFSADPRGYHGRIRISTGFTMLHLMTYLTPEVAASFTTPFRIIHGNHDRVTSHLHSVKFHEAAGSQDKELEIYEGYEHVMLKVGTDEKDDEQRQRALKDMETWFLQRV